MSKRFFKNALIMALSFLMVFSLISIHDVHAASGSSIDNPISITTGTNYSASLDNSTIYYTYTLSTSGTLKFTIENSAVLRIYVYDCDKNEVYESYYIKSSVTTNTEEVVLTSGQYYIGMSSYSDPSISFKITFTSAGESFKETTGGINNTIKTASTIKTGTTYKGQIAVNDDVDLYKITLSTSGLVTITEEQDVSRLNYIVYKVVDGEVQTLISENSLKSGDTTNKISGYWNSGTYYISFGQYSSCYGNYSFKVSFTSSGESFKEVAGGSNNSRSSANKISLNTTYKGVIAKDDDEDYYKFTVSKKTSITIKVTATSIDEVGAYLLNSEGTELASCGADYSYSGTCTYTLSKGTYYLLINDSSAGWIYQGNYSFKITNSLSSATLSTTTYTYNGKTKTPSVTVKNGAGTTLTKGTDYTVSYASGRKSIGSYKVTIKGTGEYTGTITKTIKINPKKVTISKAKSSSKKKLTVKWKKVSGSVKYKIAYRVKGTSTWKYKYVSSSTYSKTLTGLKSGKTYQVRVRAYKKVSGTTYYGSWSSIKTVKVK